MKQKYNEIARVNADSTPGIERKILTATTNNNGSFPVHFTLNHTGKMEGIQSLSTSVLKNEFCQTRRNNPETICYHCFAAAQMEYYKNMVDCFGHNFDILTSRILSVEEIPVFKVSVFRGESFGDQANEIQIENVLNLAKYNPATIVTFWSKNIWLWDRVIARTKKPANLILIQSSVFLNRQMKVTSPNVDKVFTVYDDATIEAKNININCGARSCKTCRRCYTKTPDLEIVNERLR